MRIATDADVDRALVLERQLADTLRQISTIETDPELPEVQAEEKVRVELQEIRSAREQYLEERDAG